MYASKYVCTLLVANLPSLPVHVVHVHCIYAQCSTEFMPRTLFYRFYLGGGGGGGGGKDACLSLITRLHSMHMHMC